MTGPSARRDHPRLACQSAGFLIEVVEQGVPVLSAGNEAKYQASDAGNMT